MRLLPLLVALLPLVCFAQYNGQPSPLDLQVPIYGPAVIPPTWGHQSYRHSHSRSRSDEKRRKHRKEGRKKACSKCKKLSSYQGTSDTPSSQPQISYTKGSGCATAVATCPADGKVYKFYGFPDSTGKSGQGFLLSRGTSLERTLKCNSDKEWEVDSLEFGQDVAVQSLLCTTGCPTGWQLFEQSCYFLGEDPLAWSAAEAACVADGAHLASIHSQAEQDFVASLSDSGIWFGLYSTSPNVNFYIDNTAIDYTHYEPSGTTGPACYGVCNTPQCSTRTWWRVPDCSTPKVYVCKKPM